MTAWRHITIAKLAWMCHQAPERVRWQIRLKPGGNKLEILTANGRLDFKLTGSAWVRKQTL